MIRLFVFLIISPLSAFAQDSSPWTERIELFGDIRVRHDYNSKTKPADTSEAHKERLRLRFGLGAKVNESIKARVRLATNDGTTPISTNQSLTDNASKKAITVDQALIDWTLGEGQLLTLGKMENPLRVLSASQLMYDVDYTPEGAAYSGQYGGLFLRTAGFSIQERSQQVDGTSEPDSWLLAALVGFKSEVSDKMALSFAGGYHNFTALKKNAALDSGNKFYGNSSVGDRYRHDYQIGELLAELKMKGDKCVTTIYGDLLNNFYLEEDNMAYQVGASYQTLDDGGKPVWTLGYAYISVDKDATVSAINNSDFANGNDGAFGHMLQAGRAVGTNANLSLTWYRSKIDSSGVPFESDRGLLDLSVSF